MKKTGVHFYSKYKNSFATVIDPNSKRFKTESKKMIISFLGSCGPGPGEYAYLQTLNDNGSYILSNYKGKGKRIIGNEKRYSFIDAAIKKSLNNYGIKY